MRNASPVLELACTIWIVLDLTPALEKWRDTGQGADEIAQAMTRIAKHLETEKRMTNKTKRTGTA